ncbi:Ras protein-specific guanine nucleotide-releasing factor [Blomia tropicalis]|nr:Ras protein-specific guanine nucleotide-releasing factor [Blomia tropicalis]
MRMNELQLLALAEKALHDNGIRGHLFKRTSENSKWQMRYFVLFQNILFYFENESTSKPSGLIFLEGSYCDKMVTPSTGKSINTGSANLQHYFAITYRKEGSKTFELKAESETECNAWVHAIETASFSKMLLQKEELEQKHLHLVQIVESEKTAKWQYTQQCEELTMEIKKLRAELCALKREWRLTPNNKPNSLIGLTCSDDSEEVRKIKKVQSFFRGWLCRRRWKQIVIEYINSPHAENMRKRNSLVFRMVEAEEEYLEQLQLMVSCFLRPFKMAASSQKPPCNHDEVNSIFLNAETVMFLHQIFLKGLTARMECWPTLVLVLAECKQREKFASMLRRLEEKPIIQGRTLETFLTYPMHQVPRYIITLHELLAHTPHNHVERKSLENARMKLEELSRQMHDEVSETENIRNNLAIERIIVGGCDILLDVNQVFIRKGSVLQVLTSDRFKTARARIGSFRGDKEVVRQCYLFSNHMLLCTRTSGGKLTLVESIGKIPLAEATLIEDPNEQFQFTIDDGDGSLSSASSHSSEAGSGQVISFAMTAASAIAISSTPTNSGKDFGGLDFKIIVDAKQGPPITIHLVAPTLQEKTAWISDISQTNSASSSTTTSSTSRKSSTVSGLFKSASSPTPPTDFRQNSSTSSGETGLQPAPQQPPVEKLSRSTALFRYGRAINRSLHSALGNNNTNSSNETSTSNETAESSCQIAGSASSNARLLTAGSNVTEFVPKSPVSPKMPSRFKFSKNKVKSNSAMQESSKSTSKKDKKSSSTTTTSSHRTLSNKNVGKLRKMGALECPVVPNDIVFEEGDNNKCIDNVHFNDLFHGTLNDASSITMPHSIRNDPRLFKDDVDIRFSRTLNSCKLPQIRYASPERLFERLTDLRFLSIDFLNTFLLTYRVFTDSITVIEALKRVHYSPEFPLSSMSAALHDSSGSLEEGVGGGGQPGRTSGGGGIGVGDTIGSYSGTHLHPHPSPGHSLHLGANNQLLNIHANPSNSSSGAVANVSVANEYLSTTIEYDYSRRISTIEEEQARERYLKRMNNRNAHGSISSTCSSNVGQEFVYSSLTSGEPMLLPIGDPISMPVPPPPSPEVPGYIQKELAMKSTSLAYTGDSGGSSNDDSSPVELNESTETTTSTLVTVNENLQVPVHSQSCDTLTEQSNPTSPLSSATSSATLVGSDSKSGSPRPSPVRKSPPQKLPSNEGNGETQLISTTNDVIFEENEESIEMRKYKQAISEVTPPSTPSLTSTPKHGAQQQQSIQSMNAASISSVGSCFVMQSKNQTLVTKGGESRSSSISQPCSGQGQLSATSTTMNYLRVRGAGSKRGSGSSESESVGSTSVTPRSSFQTDTTGISTPRSSFQHPDSPQMSSKAGVVVTSSRATSRRSSTASAASAFAVATAASSNPPEPMDPMLKQLPSRSSSRFSSATGADLKIPNIASGGGSGQSSAASVQQQLNVAAANAARCKRESMISTAATMRVLNVLRHWVSKHSQDFENDAKLLQITTEFLDELVHNTNLLPAEHKAAVQLQQMIAKQTMEAKEKLDLDVLLAPPLNPSKDTIETLSALEIAEVMTYIDHNIFIRIQSEEFLGQAWMKDDKSTKAFHILLMTKHFNDISRLVASEILLVAEIPKRVSVIEKWAAVADICRCLHNFNGVLQICAAFTNSSVFRLKRTWEKVTKTTRQTIEKLQTLVSTDGRFRNMREALHRCDPPCIPYLGMYLTDLSFIEEGTPNFTDDGLLNFSKMRMIAHVIREIRHFQQTPYKIELNSRVTNYLLDTSRHLQDEILYQKSLCLEPRLSRLSTKISYSGPSTTSPSSTMGTSSFSPGQQQQQHQASSSGTMSSNTTPSHSHQPV